MTVIVAYSCGAANYTGGSNEMCLMWSSELTDLQEEYQDGLTIFVRSTPSDIGIFLFLLQFEQLLTSLWY